MTKAEMAAEIDQLKAKCDKQAEVLRHLLADRVGFTAFISGESGEVDSDNMPERLFVCPAYGCDFHYVYHRGETEGPGW